MRNKSIISSKGQIVVPSALRKRFRLNEGTTGVFQEEAGRLVLEPRNYDAIFALEGSVVSADPVFATFGKSLKWLKLPPYVPNAHTRSRQK